MSNSNKHRPSSWISTPLGRIAANIGLVIVEAGSFVIFKAIGLQRFHRPVVENPHHPYLGWIHHPNITIEARNCGGPTSALQTNADSVVDATKALDGGSEGDIYYVDQAHYNDQGAAALAQFMLDQIRPTVEEIAHREKDESTSKDARIPANPGRAPIIDGEDWLAGRRS